MGHTVMFFFYRTNDQHSYSILDSVLFSTVRRLLKGYFQVYCTFWDLVYELLGTHQNAKIQTIMILDI